jgi:opacity protein-like surface antigen
METTLENGYLSLSLKPHIPLGSHFQAYLGAGGDFYYTHSKMEGDYQRGGTYIYINRSEENFSFGFHGLAGLEVLLLKDPTRFGVADMPMSLFLEYKYSYVPVKGVDEGVVKDINSAVGSSLDSHDLNVGGHLVFLGLRWRF